jgi:thymidylate kinase
MIICEGPDGGGKSHLASKLALLLNWQRRICGGSAHNEEQFWRLIAEELFLPEKVVCDRTVIISEYIYTRALKRQAIVSTDIATEQIRRLCLRRPIFIYCRPSITLLKDWAKVSIPHQTNSKPYKSKEHCEAVLQNIEQIVKEYDALMHELITAGLTIITYNREEDFKHGGAMAIANLIS